MRRFIRWGILFLCVLLASLASGAATAGPTPQGGKPPLKRAAVAPLTISPIRDRLDKLQPDADGRVHLIVELTDPPVARQHGSESASPALKVGTHKLDLASAAAKGYTARLEQAQTTFKTTLTAKLPSVSVKHSYQVVFNGLAISLPQTDVHRLSGVPGIKQVYPDTLMRISLDASLPLIGAPAAWQTLGGASEAGRGVKVAVIDTGIRPENPLFDGAGFNYPTDNGPWPKGYCATTPGFCNGKVIAARFYPTLPMPSVEVASPLDREGHGTHTAGTAVGNTGVTATVGGISAPISGVAPAAWLMVYKGLFADGAGSAIGPVSNLTMALEDAVRDGADVINNSWGSGPGDPTENPAAVAAENAVAAGVIVVFAAGNLGPDSGSVAVPGNTPSVITVGATTTPRSFTALIRVQSDSPNLLGLGGASVGRGAFGPFVLAEGVADTSGDVSGLALDRYAPGTFSGKIVLVKRGTNARVAKSKNVAAGGAIGMVLYNDKEGQNTVADAHTIPTVHVNLSEGQLLRDYILNNPNPRVTMTAAAPNATRPDVMADFSSRGPNWKPEYIKPELVAPGVNILSGYSPDNTLDPTNFTVLAGTSMAAPHVAGAASLIHQRYPGLTPAQVKSALMTSASLDGIVLENGATPATIHQRGAGRLNVSAALDPGLVFDKPSLGLPAVIGRARQTITATNISTTPGVYNVSAINPTPETRLLVEPTNFTLAPGASIQLTVTVDLVGAPLTAYPAGQINFSEVGGSRQAHIITWFQAAPSKLPSRLDLSVRSDNGDHSFSLTPNLDLAALDVTTFGLAAPDKERVSITQDPDQLPETNPLDPANGWRVYPYTVSAKTAVIAAQTSRGVQTLEDVDLYLLRDANSDGRFDFGSEVLRSSLGSKVEEEVRLENPEPGLYAVAVHGFLGQGDFDLRVWQVEAGGNLQISGPARLTAGTPASLRLGWQNLTSEGEQYYGLVRLAGPTGPLGAIPVTITRLPEKELTLQAEPTTVEAGRPVTYSYTVTNFEDRAVQYTLVDQLPENLRVVPDSLQGLTYDEATRQARAQFSLRPARDPLDFLDSRAGQIPAIPYIDLPTQFGTAPLPQGNNGDDAGLDIDLPEGAPPFTFLGQTYRKFGVVSNGYVVPGGLLNVGDIQYRPVRLPDLARPNPMLAPFWADLDLSAGIAGHGEWYADVITGGVFGNRHALIVQWREAAGFGKPETRFSFEVALVLETGDVYFIYATMQGTIDAVSVGVENEDGSQGKSWYFNGEPAAHAPASDHTLQLDYIPNIARYAQHTVTYRARPMAAGTFTNRVTLRKEESADSVFGSVSVKATAPALRTLHFMAAPDKSGYARPFIPRTSVFGEGVWAGSDAGRGLTYYGLFQTAPLVLPNGATLTRAWVELVGHNSAYLDAKAVARWSLDLLDESVDEQLTQLTFNAIASAPVDATLTPVVTTAQVGVGRTNVFDFTLDQLSVVKSRAGRPLSFRLNGRSLGDRRAIFGWDGGAGGNPPTLKVEYLPAIIELP